MLAEREATLSQLAALVPGAVIEGDPDCRVRGLAYDSRQVAPGDLFFAVPGFDQDGAAFVAEAVRAGAVAVVVEGPVAAAVPRLRVERVREAMGRVAVGYFGHPGEELLSAGVTGTNGKTTVAMILAGIFDAAGLRSGVVGTIRYRVGGKETPAARTTPEAIDLQRLLREMRDAGDGAVALEVSSHAIALGRVWGLSLDALVFTNLTRDHLDFHGTIEAYYETKRRMFRQSELAALGARVGAAVVNADDAYGRRLAGETDLPVTTFGETEAASVRLVVPERSFAGTRLHVRSPRGEMDVWLPLPGLFNERNAIAAIAAAEALDLPREAIAQGIEEARSIPGRFEIVENALGLTVIVDYAHTPDGMRALLESVRALAPGRIVTLFGCGGNRDRGKRPLMGRAAGEGSDLVVLTSDNPRDEDPAAIIADAEEGLRATGTRYVVCPDRREAIGRAFDAASPGDVVVLAGKGHESTQEIGGRRHPFQDAEVAREILRARAGGRSEKRHGERN
jgi:UDP-N-acetylmuramoyl-L-alanyl-D-glutamate--2,6-diaminopimelate ligase